MAGSKHKEGIIWCSKLSALFLLDCLFHNFCLSAGHGLQYVLTWRNERHAAGVSCLYCEHVAGWQNSMPLGTVQQ